jgi:signal transduction histidine kinase
VSATPSPSADPEPGPTIVDLDRPAAARDSGTQAAAASAAPRSWKRFIPSRIRRLGPKTLQSRLTLGIAGVVALTLFLVTIFVLNRLDDEFRRQQTADLRARTELVARYVDALAGDKAGGQPVIDSENVLNPRVEAAMNSDTYARFMADQLAEADVDVVFGTLPMAGGDSGGIDPATNGFFHVSAMSPGRQGLTQESFNGEPTLRAATSSTDRYVIVVRLSNPFTFRQTAIDNVATVTAAVGALALGIAVLVAAALALRVTTPLRRLTEASRALAEGQIAERIPEGDIRDGPTEVAELATQFNAMADQVEESMERIRRDRDRSRDFLADVSHELRTPIAALLTFNELLTERTGEDPVARAEFLHNSRVQLERLDWLAQNLLELSKLDSGLVLLDLRPDDLRVAVESSVDQAGPAARRRSIGLSLSLPEAPVRIRHDPQRIGQVVTNLVGNAIKFTEPGGSVTVQVAPTDDGARIEVRDTGIGIEPAELPRIFERFYRGSLANEARGSGSGLGLAIVKSIVDMHHGTVEVSSTLGSGTTFVVTLPADPRHEPGFDASGIAPAPAAQPPADRGKVVDSSPSGVRA